MGNPHIKEKKVDSLNELETCYPLEIFVKAEEEYKCMINLGILNDPIILNCGILQKRKKL